MIKKKICLVVYCSFFFFETNAQIGINTDYPKALFHIDAKSDNGSATTPITISDDVVFDSEGNMGIGTITPIAKVDIKGTLRVDDGTQRKNFGLKSDADGVANWGPVSIATRVDMANLGTGINSLNILSIPSSQQTYYPTGGYITLFPGKSIIRASFGNKLSESLPGTSVLQIRYTLSTSPTILVAPDFLNPAGMGYVTLTGLFPQTMLAGSGYWLVENKTTSNQKLYLFYSVVYIGIASNTINLMDIGSASVPETMVTISLITG
ncbi:hypothetical protein [Dysgonomonas sp. GY617]|uniref:hypothetical protein n=1 Tax=Dysgonomonas sp. GY617 TaxID=2780420 RepID=UPI00188394C9|nr:hypothetical protein [Dysgonomonas sp. GY617]MBF0577217.1 hypothetical protein [Dysgonomonas sp. GY617]